MAFYVRRKFIGRAEWELSVEVGKKRCDHVSHLTNCIQIPFQPWTMTRCQVWEVTVDPVGEENRVATALVAEAANRGLFREVQVEAPHPPWEESLGQLPSRPW